MLIIRRYLKVGLREEPLERGGINLIMVELGASGCVLVLGVLGSGKHLATQCMAFLRGLAAYQQRF
jgi:hypothetical protein